MIDEICVTRAEYEATFGRKPPPGAMGALVCTTEGKPLVYCFFATVDDEIATLEHLFSTEK